MKRLVLVAMVAVAGCYSDGQVKITREDYRAMVVVGKTTKGDLLKLLGKPMGIEVGSEPERWTYTYEQGRSKIESYIPILGWFYASYNTLTDSLTVAFDGAGVVKSSSYGRLAGGGSRLDAAVWRFDHVDLKTTPTTYSEDPAHPTK